MKTLLVIVAKFKLIEEIKHFLYTLKHIHSFFLLRVLASTHHLDFVGVKDSCNRLQSASLCLVLGSSHLYSTSL